MTDNRSKRVHRKRIDVSQAYECRYWSEKFDVTPAQLRKAVSRVGPMVKDVQRELNGSRSVISLKSLHAVAETIGTRTAVGLLVASISLGLGIWWFGDRLRERLH